MNVNQTAVKNYMNFIGGVWKAPRSDSYYPNINPADEEDIIGNFPLSTGEDADEAVKCAYEAFASWSRLLPQERATYSNSK